MKTQTYILLFRGVGGATQLPTAPLRLALTAAGFKNVSTYINSGNAVVSSDLPREQVIARIADICRRKFNFTKLIFAPTLREWHQLIADNPFPKAAAIGKTLHAAVLSEKPSVVAIAALKAIAVQGEGIEVIGRVAYLHTPNGFGTSKFAKQFDKGIGVANTARNWNTVCKLHELASAAATDHV